MADYPGMSIQPAEVLDVSQQLDLLAERMHRVMEIEAANLTVTASGRDEVSQRIAATLNDVHTLFGASADQGVAEMHTVAATFRQHSNNVMAVEEAIAS